MFDVMLRFFLALLRVELIEHVTDVSVELVSNRYSYSFCLILT